VGMETTNRDDWEHVGPYRIQNRIGAGGYAEVFAGVDSRNGQRVALKRLRLKHRGDLDSRDRFEREGLALEAIDHPNIVRCFGILVQEDEVWIVMELLRGFTLRQLLRDRGPLSVERALLIAIDVADGLADMHEMAIVHRDLKPENVFLTLPGFAVKIVDLGVAKFHGWSVPATDPGLLVCTPSYAAPEMSLGYAVDARSDIYALGLVLYEALVGRNPFANGDGTLPVGQDALTAHIVRSPPPVSTRRPDVPEGVSALIAQMMAKDPTGRPPAMKVVARELRRALRALRKERSVPAPGGSRPPPDTDASGARHALELTTEVLAESAERPLVVLPTVEGDAATDPAALRAGEDARPVLLPTPEPVDISAGWPQARRLAALALVALGTMLIGGACGVVVSVRMWELSQMPAAWSLYCLIGTGALAGTGGALLLHERAAMPGLPPVRPSAWILAAGIATGMLIGAAATWLLVAPPPAPGPPARSNVVRPA
jgi:serine/threonine protein kinase